MDKLVRRVTVVQSSGEHRDAKVVYENDEDEDTDDESPGQRHLDSVAKGGNSWIVDDPGNFMKARRKALKEMRKASPFGMPKMEFDDDDDDDDE